MKSLQLNALSSVIPLTALLAAASFMTPAAKAESNSTLPPGGQAQSGALIAPGPTMGQQTETVKYVSPPSTAISIPSAYETIGMRQARYQASQHTTWLVQPGMSPTWFGIATALDTVAAMGKPQKVLATNYVVASLQSSPLEGNELRIYQMRIQASQNALDVVQAQSVQFSGDSQAQLRDDMRDAHSSQAQLESSMQSAEQVAPNTTGDQQARSTLAGDYSRYSEATARVEHLASQ